MGWIYESRIKYKLKEFMVLLNWIEQQLLKIIWKYVIFNKKASKDMPILETLIKIFKIVSRPEKTASKNSNAQRIIKSNQWLINRNKKWTSPVFRLVYLLKVAKTSGKSKSLIYYQQHNLHNTQLSPMKDAD